MPNGRTRRLVRIVTRSAVDDAKRTVRRRTSDDTAAHHNERAVALRRMLEDVGPLYIKVGQILATRPDIVPQYLRDELEKLNDQARVSPFVDFEPVLAAELGPEWRSCFQSIDTTHPLGSASIAQVYKGVWRDGRPCVVKVQRPSAAADVRGDMVVLRRVTWVISRIAPHFTEVVDLRAMLEMLFAVMQDELDFTHEARNMKHARKTAREFKRIKVPKVLCATPRVLVQSFAEGVPINRVKDTELTRRKRKQIGDQLIAFMLYTYFVKREFHADPHPGNIIVSEDGHAYLIDWGMVGKLDRRNSRMVMATILGLVRNDGEALARGWIALGRVTPWGDATGFIQDVSSIVPRWAGASLQDLNYGVALMSLARFSARRGIQVSPLITVVGKSFANIEGSVRGIHPKTKIAASFGGIMQRILRDLAADQMTLDEGAQAALEMADLRDSGARHLVSFARDLAYRESSLGVRPNLADVTTKRKRHRQRTSLG
ncbi:putative protein kinase UbiB [Actinomadura rubteroloni]|uniref:ABC1 atypical kinase-like domain-containing protein n=1 Tax=Actinomadura rubteroloni TaxID=1926885 RepID=A0A2P4UEV7_9ACTN|nr:AarF/UbiB family protein [Actinomadura rubteroloni]POM23575.1 putative protein kinase UbiB [Actinomadura rubteroloni]